MVIVQPMPIATPTYLVFIMNPGCRPLESYDSPIAHNEYRIALGVSDYEEVYWLGFILTEVKWDYHFMVQTNSGQWAEKVGACGKTILHEYGNPDFISWDRTGMGGYNYTSDIKYFAITN